MLNPLIASIVLLSGSALGQINCGFPPSLECLAKSAQYGILGRIVSTNANDASSGATPQNFTASVQVLCAFSTHDSTLSSGAGLQGSQITVANFGVNKPGCPAGASSGVTANTTRLLFVHVSTQNPRPGQPMTYSIVDVCVGGIEASDSNIRAINDFTVANPKNAIPTQFRGTGEQCSLRNVSPPSASPSASATPSASPAPKASSARKFAEVLTGLLGIAWVYLV